VWQSGATGGLRVDSIAVAHLIQPVRADDLKERWGQLSELSLERILVAIAWSIGLVP
jgi:mRNA-degrading endonuclease toxin of MazEF toxin-antitoxin module